MRRWAAVVVVLGFTADFAPAARAGAGRDSTGTICGWVRDSISGKPIAFASAWSATTRPGAQADENGWFYVRGLRPGRHSFMVKSQGYRPRADSVWVQVGHIDMLRVLLGAQPPSTDWDCYDRRHYEIKKSHTRRR